MSVLMKKKEKPFLNDVCLVRIVLILMLVLFHSFAIFSGGWAPLEKQPSIPLYWWIGKVSYSCFLEAFVFISGYTFSFNNRIENSTVYKEILRKCKRLMIPCVVFGTVYYLLFGDLKKNTFIVVYEIVVGVGHLWFLPMLFGCFLISIILSKYHFSKCTVIGWFAVLALLSFISVPFRIHEVMYYMLFFYLGFCFAPLKHMMPSMFTKQMTICWFVLFVLLFVAVHYTPMPLDTFSFDEKIFVYIMKKGLRIIYSSLGILFLFSAINLYLSSRKSDFEIPRYLKVVSSYCFGIYIYQQFILKMLYKNLYHYVSYEALPWIGFLFTLLVSTLLTAITLHFHVGKKLVG